MKKYFSKLYLVFIIILYNVFCYIYSTDGLKIQLAKKIENNKYDYIKYVYSSVSDKLYVMAIIGMIITGLFFIVYSTYKVYRYIKRYTKIKALQILAILVFVVILVILLYLCKNYYVNINMLIGEEM